MQTTDLPFYIFTGGPGVGKSTTLDALKKRGYQTLSLFLIEELSTCSLSTTSIPHLIFRKFQN
jgi:predicted ATPase